MVAFLVICGVGMGGVFSIMFFVDRVLTREKADPLYAIRLNRFRDRVQKFTPSRDTQLYIVIFIIVILFVIFSTTGELTIDE